MFWVGQRNSDRCCYFTSYFSSRNSFRVRSTYFSLFSSGYSYASRVKGEIMKFMKFDEYLNSKGKVESKPDECLDGDRIDPSTMPNTPPSGGKPYVAKGEKMKKEKALGDQGDEELVYEPKVDNKSKGKAPAKIPTVEQAGLVTLVTKAVKENPMVIEALVRNLKHEGLLGFFVAETLNHRDTYKHISEIMAHESYGPEVCNKLARAMNEETAAPFSDQLDLDDEADVDDEANDSSQDPTEDEMSGEEDSDMGDEMGSDDSEAIDAEVEPEVGDDEEEDQEEMGPLSPEMFKNHPAVKNLQKALMRSYMRRMMDRM